MSKPRILLMPDLKGWAQDGKANGIIKYASDKYDFTKMYLADIKKIKYNDWDLILLFPWFAYNQLPQPIKREKMIAGVSSHRQLENVPDAKKILNERFAALAPVSWLLDGELKNEHPSVFYCPNGVDTEVFVDYGKRSYTDAPTFGWVGKERWEGKNYKSIIERAIGEVYKTKFKSILVNDMQQKKIPLFPAKKMVDYYNSIDVIMCASKSEGTPNPVLEGAACGTMVLSVQVGNVFEFGVPNYNYVEAERSVESFVECIKRIKKMTPRDRRFLSDNVKQTIRNVWSWKIRIRNYINMFDKLLG